MAKLLSTILMHPNRTIKRPLLFLLVLLTSALSVHAQEEVPTDTINGLPATVKNYDGFLLDMGLMNLSAPTLPRFTLEVPDASKDYSSLFRLNPNESYSQGFYNPFSLNNSTYYSSNPFGLTGFGNAADNLQMGSFRLKNGMRLNTYGQYDKDGWRVPNPSALPWEKNNFKGAFELKSANGAFGIRIEVQQGKHVPY